MTSPASDAALLWGAELRRGLIELRRYWSETVIGLVILTVIFVGLLYGMNAVGGAGAVSSTGALVMGFFLWSLAQSAYGGVAHDVSNEASLGTLEQLALAPHRLVQVFTARAATSLATGLVTSIVLLFAAMAISGRWVAIDAGSVLAMACGLPALYGVGLALGALALVLKRVTALLAATHILLIFVIGMGAEPFTVGGLIPFAAAATLAMRAAVHGVPVMPAELGFLLATSGAYVALGAGLFALAERRARRDNTLEHY